MSEQSSEQQRVLTTQADPSAAAVGPDAKTDAGKLQIEAVEKCRRCGEPVPPNEGGVQDSAARLRALRDEIENELTTREIRRALDHCEESRFGRVAKHQLTHILVGFLLTGVLGGVFSHCWSEREKEVEAQRVRGEKEIEAQRAANQRDREQFRSFSDRLNEIRVDKIGGVWEKLFLYDAAANRAFELTDRLKTTYDRAVVSARRRIPSHGVVTPLKLAPSDVARLAQIRTALRHEALLTTQYATEIRDLLDRNRFWIGETMYHQVRGYLEQRGILEFYAAGTEDISQLLRMRRKKATVSITEIRDQVYKE